jgi:hypothetical protein
MSSKESKGKGDFSNQDITGSHDLLFRELQAWYEQKESSDVNDLYMAIRNVMLKFDEVFTNYTNEIDEKIANYKNSTEADTEIIAKDLHQVIYQSQAGILSSKTKARQYFPVRVYLADSGNAIQTETAILQFLEALNSEVADEYDAVLGSWFKEWLARTNRKMTRDEYETEIKKAKRALELKVLEQAQAAVNKDNSEAFSLIMKSLESQPKAICQIGSILVVKLPGDDGQGQLITRTLSQRELIFLEQNQHLLKMPDEILEQLSTSSNSGSLPKHAREEGVILSDGNHPGTPARS